MRRYVPRRAGCFRQGLRAGQSDVGKAAFVKPGKRLALKMGLPRGTQARDDTDAPTGRVVVKHRGKLGEHDDSFPNGGESRKIRRYGCYLRRSGAYVK